MKKPRGPKPAAPTPLKFDPRPVSARALKSFRDTLRPFLAGARVLDLYAGHGRFGIAAAEEGAARLVFVDHDPALVRNLSALRFPEGVHAEAHVADTLRYLATCRETFDLVIADPPFPLWDEPFAAQLVAAVAPVRAADGFFLVKYPKRMLPFQPSGGAVAWKEKIFGESALVIFRGNGQVVP